MNLNNRIMYFNNSNNFFHGIMFHHFHDDKLHSRGQGSISKDDFYKLINFIGKKNILSADIFFEKFKEDKLTGKEVCLTFDDAIKCQIDIALPVLEDLKIKSFFFVYTSLFEEKPDNLEIFRHFRMNYFKNVNDFYQSFYQKLNMDLNNFFQKSNSEINYKKKKSPHYTIEDIKFRFVRDILLGKKKYESIMFLMMDEKDFKPKELYNKLFFSKI